MTVQLSPLRRRQSYNQTAASDKKFCNLCWKIASAWSLFGIVVFVPTSVFAQSAIAEGGASPIAPDNTLGSESSNVVTNFNGLSVEEITGGATRGINLFHSFREFNISEGRGAYFLSPSADIQNILARVTGGNRSEILGRLGTFQIINGNIAASNASLFLINPNGIIFGKNASLDVDGSFAATTANAIQFGERGNFSATNPKVPQLLTINPSAFLFSQINKTASIQNNAIAPAGKDPAGIDVFGLRVPNSKSLLLVGGNVSMDGGQLNAYGGRIELAGFVEPGNINLLFDDNNLRLGFPENVARADVSLINRAAVYVEGAGDGDIAINARNIEILGGSQLSAGIGQGLGTSETKAGDITLNVTGEIKIADFGSGISNLVRSSSRGNGGNITINANSFNLQDGAQLAASTFGQGNAGNVTVTAKNAVSLLGEQTTIFSTVEAGGVGKGGNIDINGATLSLQDGAQLLTSTREASDTQKAGQGDAGNITLKVTGEVDIASKKKAIVSSLETGAEGKGGNITIDAGSFKLWDGSQIVASTFGQGNAGNITVNAKDAISLAGEQTSIFSTVEVGGVGKGGNINIIAASLSLKDGAQILTATRETSENQPTEPKNAGYVNINVTGEVDISGTNGTFPSGIGSSIGRGRRGNGGNITIDANSFKLRDGAQLIASTNGEGNAGNVSVKVSGELDIAGKKDTLYSTIFSDIGTGAEGNGGNITIDAASFNLRDSAQLAASTSGRGNAGNVTVTAKDAVSLLGEQTTIFSTVEAGGVGKGGNIYINAATLSIRDGAQLLTSTSNASDTQPAGRGDAGNVNLKVAGEVDIAGVKNGLSSAIFSRVEIGTEGNGGNITINADSLKVRDGALLDARTENNNRGGNITINANVFEAFSGGQLTTTTSSSGSAGKIAVNATDKVIISANDPNYNDRVVNFPDRISNIGANSGLFVSSTGSGITGDIEINSPKITLDNQARLNAESISGNGGNINLNSDLLLLRRSSQITTNAGTAQAGGDGGNIDINSRFIVAIPNQNNDITANAYSGKGGNINIQSRGIFGIEPRIQASDKTNDITASSQLGLSGNVDVNSPDNSSIQNSLTSFPTNVIDTNALIANSCIARANKKQENSFIITGGGALPNRPGNVLMSNYSTDRVRDVNNEITSRPWKKGDPIVEPTGVYRLSDGRLVMSRPCE
ncbi:two-partner secretion domain-containing protein [Nostoc sp.]|uniref:two-partner secretion domain-containing protein n=1 Tax=Nostoc sp. TaxID=1180 RepID=UPI002FF501DF